MTRRGWNNLLIFVCLALILGLSSLDVGEDSDTLPVQYRVLVEWTLTGESVCSALDLHDTLESCEVEASTLREMAGWHGKNNYTCITTDKCPAVSPMLDPAL